MGIHHNPEYTTAWLADMADTLSPRTITFLFTNIEGSSALWEQHPEGMRVALAQAQLLARADT